MDFLDIDQFFQGIPYNRVLYGAPSENGHFVWATDIKDLLNYPGRLKYQPIVERPFGVVRQHLIAASGSLIKGDNV